MPPWDNYFELRWTSALNSGAVTTRRYRMVLQDAVHTTKKNLTGVNFNLLGQIMRVRVAFKPRHVIGLVRVDQDEIINAPDGNLAELEEAAFAPDLEAKLWTDSAFWSAQWLQDWMPHHYDPLGEYWAIPMELQQRQ